MTDGAGLLLLVAAVFGLAGFVKGVVGLGLPTVAIGLLSVVMPAAEAAALLVVPSLVTNLWQLAAGPALGALLRRLWTMMAGVAAGTLAAAGVIQSGSSWPQAALGVALVAYAAVGLTAWRPGVPARLEPVLSPLVGLATGLVTGATGVFVIPAVPYLAALGLKKEELIQALGLSFTVSTVALGMGLAGGGTLDRAAAVASLGAVLPALLGMFAGGAVRGRVSEAAFRRVFFLGLLALGAYLVARAALRAV